MVISMKSIGKFFKGIIIFVWIVLAVFTTICLISYNDYKVTVFGKESLVIVDSDELEPTFKNHDLAIITKQSEKNLKVGDQIFFYSGNKTDSSYVNYGAITDIQTDPTAESAYFIGEKKVSYSDVIGKGDGAIVYHKVGLVLSILESRWGYMFLVILPTLFALVYEIYAITKEVKAEAKKELDEK